MNIPTEALPVNTQRRYIDPCCIVEDNAYGRGWMARVIEVNGNTLIITPYTAFPDKKDQQALAKRFADWIWRVATCTFSETLHGELDRLRPYFNSATRKPK